MRAMNTQDMLLAVLVEDEGIKLAPNSAQVPALLAATKHNIFDVKAQQAAAQQAATQHAAVQQAALASAAAAAAAAAPPHGPLQPAEHAPSVPVNQQLGVSGSAAYGVADIPPSSPGARPVPHSNAETAHAQGSSTLSLDTTLAAGPQQPSTGTNIPD